MNSTGNHVAKKEQHNTYCIFWMSYCITRAKQMSWVLSAKHLIWLCKHSNAVSPSQTNEVIIRSRKRYVILPLVFSSSLFHNVRVYTYTLYFIHSKATEQISVGMMYFNISQLWKLKIPLCAFNQVSFSFWLSLQPLLWKFNNIWLNPISW